METGVFNKGMYMVRMFPEHLSSFLELKTFETVYYYYTCFIGLNWGLELDKIQRMSRH